MTDQASRDDRHSVAKTWMMRGRAEPVSKASDKVVPLVAPGSEPDTQSVRRDLPSALELIHEASEAIRISEERANELEAQLDALTRQATDEMTALETRLAAAEEGLMRSEERARHAEQRATEAEAWLARLHDAVFKAFAPQSREGAPQSRRPDVIENSAAQNAARG